MDFLLNSYQFLNCQKAIQRKALNPPAFSALLMIPVHRISASVQKSKREPLCGGSRFCESYLLKIPRTGFAYLDKSRNNRFHDIDDSFSRHKGTSFLKKQSYISCTFFTRAVFE